MHLYKQAGIDGASSHSGRQAALDGYIGDVGAPDLIGLVDGHLLEKIAATAAGHHTLELSESSSRGGLLIKGWVSFQLNRAGIAGNCIHS